MRSLRILAALLGLGIATTAQAATDISIDQLSLKVPNRREVRVDFPVGKFRVEPSNTGDVSFDLSARCKGSLSSCEDRAERVHVEAEERGGVLHLKVRGYPKFNTNRFSLRGVLRMPSDLALRVDMGVGALTIEDMEGDLDVDLGVGDADIRTPGHAVRSVEISTGVGDAEVIARGNRVHHRTFMSATANWREGRGRSNVNVSVGVGEGTVRVD